MSVDQLSKVLLWTTANRQLIRFIDMKTSHIKNTINRFKNADNIHVFKYILRRRSLDDIFS